MKHKTTMLSSHVTLPGDIHPKIKYGEAIEDGMVKVRGGGMRKMSIFGRNNNVNTDKRELSISEIKGL